MFRCLNLMQKHPGTPAAPKNTTLKLIHAIFYVRRVVNYIVLHKIAKSYVRVDSIRFGKPHIFEKGGWFHTPFAFLTRLGERSEGAQHIACIIRNSFPLITVKSSKNLERFCGINLTFSPNC